MTPDQLMTFYVAGAVVTALGTRNLNRFYRRTLLWPLYWLYVGALVLIEINEAIRGR
ncbi:MULTISPECIES: hypothetical protein [Pseudomonas]|uniref:hypothetical protein n=1 Tax=Pseudomonas TaxID=286 RepID=UPI000B3307E8|nr:MULTISPECIES: hypothetical protein [Pseudomonas]MDG9809495.1 hypothetical protein [Pseudomonas juntendi]MDG9815741.1 hypothetical protein [Pseudomonas putida]